MEGKVVLVTGELDGIGGSTAALLADESAQIFVTDVADVNETHGNSVHLMRMDHGRKTKGSGGITYLSVDVRDEDAWSGIVGDILRRFGRLDLLVNIAGTAVVEVGSKPQFPANVSLEVWPAIYGNDSKRLFPGCQHAIKAMLWSGGGSIINVRSNSGSGTGSDSLLIVGNPGEVADSVLRLALQQKQQNR